MARNKKPRKKYKPRNSTGELELPVNIRYGPRAELDLQMVPHAELDRMREGTATEYSLGALNFRINCGYVMAGEVFDNPEVRATMEKALVAIRAVIERWRRVGRVGCTMPEFDAIGDGLNVCDAMQKASTRREQVYAMEIVDRVVEWKLYRENEDGQRP